MSLAKDSKRLAIVEQITGEVIRPQSLPGIDIRPLIDALMQFLLQLLDDCPMSEIRRAAEQSAKRPVIRLFWRLRLQARLPQAVRQQLPDAAGDLLAAGATLSPADWAGLE